MNYILQGLGIFIYPLGICSVLAVAIFLERFWALRSGAVVSREMDAGLREGKLLAGEDDTSLAGRLVRVLLREKLDHPALKARCELELVRLERGFFVIETIVPLAPMLGLLGTVWGLVDVFNEVMLAAGGTPDISRFSQGIALALATTVAGLIIAMVALLGVNLLHRRLDLAQARLNLVTERALEIHRRESGV